jgi:protocatechuate 3,4-dioxygenase, alpha subunit
MSWLNMSQMAQINFPGEQVTIEGCVLDGNEKPVNDAVIEIWQANAHGKYAHPEDAQERPLQAGFRGFGRVFTDDSGAFHLTTIRPGTVPGPDGTWQAPHLVVSVAMRGLLKRLVTRIYFPGEPANDHDPILQLVEPARRSTLIARKSTGREGFLEWNVILQGDDETVFFDC